MKAEHPVAALCAALAVSRSGYYRWQQATPSVRAAEDARLSAEIHTVHRESRGTYGSPRVMRELRRRGHAHSRKRVARLMKAAELRGSQPRRFVPQTTQSGHAEPIAPNRLAEAPRPTKRDQVWVSDITYVRTAEGWLYVAAIMDLYSRRIVGWATGASLAAELVLRALAMALLHRRPPAGLLYHSDRGVQYACGDFRAALADAQLVASMSRKGNCYDNAAMESFWSTYKRECAGLLFATRRAATAATFAYLETFYNRVRLHSALGYQSPVDFENQRN
jgi:transposase InsO family protein